jgi:hypothetical protein
MTQATCSLVLGGRGFLKKIFAVVGSSSPSQRKYTTWPSSFTHASTGSNKPFEFSLIPTNTYRSIVEIRARPTSRGEKLKLECAWLREQLKVLLEIVIGILDDLAEGVRTIDY